MVVVRVRMDGQSRELLMWVLVKVAEPRVCDDALHVLPSNAAAADCSDRGTNFPSCSSLISLVKSFDSGLSVYEGFCNLKQEKQMRQIVLKAMEQAISKIVAIAEVIKHDQGNDCDLWKLAEFNLDSQFELDAQFHLKQHGQGDDCDLWKLTEFNLDS
ncbi:hypothetical protein Taro_036958 [Colocasia esculenta]|uniref:DNA/RNA-binding protein Alba-like domain-containing protein n=1 Tax=Colocasia esculenta TaxID=4460 RepID=A0A843WHU0_COLES|nr:hypothetical protein [Colocasia esculenta]